MKNKFVVFDLDDTLYAEIDFLKSAYFEIANILDTTNSKLLYQRMLALYSDGKNVFEILSDEYSSYSLELLLKLYRNHIPNINLKKNASEILYLFIAKGYKLGLLTDGRSITQRNKIKQLSIETLFNIIVISEEFGSEKPSIDNYKAFMRDNDCDFCYVADNPQKDFISPNKLGWKTVCLLDDGSNINKQNFSLPTELLPNHFISDFVELIGLI